MPVDEPRWVQLPTPWGEPWPSDHDLAEQLADQAATTELQHAIAAAIGWLHMVAEQAGRRTAGAPSLASVLRHVGPWVDTAMIAAVQLDRDAGATWTTIGDLFGITRQTAAERFRPRIGS